MSVPNLTTANLSGADLRDSNLSRTNLWEANFSGADLTDTNLSRANLQRANMKHTNMFRLQCDEKTILPDGIQWTVDVDWSKYGAATLDWDE